MVQIKTLKCIFVILLCSIFSTAAFAIFCPNNFSNINIGDTLEQVFELCGNPKTQNHYKQSVNLSEEWSYYINANFNNAVPIKMIVVFQGNSVVNINIAESSHGPGIYAGLPNGQPVLSLSYNGNQSSQNVTSTAVCGPTIKTGDSMQQVETVCGKPASINQNKDPRSTAAVDIVELKYGGVTPATLIFENGILKERVQG